MSLRTVVAHPDATFAPAQFSDPAFDPQPGFNFEDMHDGEGGNLQQNVASLQGLQGQISLFQPVNAGGSLHTDIFSSFPAGSGAFGGRQGAPSQTANVDPVDLWQESKSPQGPLLPQSVQSQIAKRRGISQQFGQITPPDDTTSEGFARPKTADLKAGARAEKNPILDKSERARNAANPRHAKPKKARKDSAQDEMSIDSEEVDVGEKKEKYREKNRLAAAKCRAKKKENIGGIEETHRRLQAQNSWLRREEQSLRHELTTLRTNALQHQSCGCGDIQNYNIVQAQNMARSHQQQMVSVSSPSETVSSLAASPMGHPSRRTQSVSNPSMPSPAMVAAMQNGRHSFATPTRYAFGPVTTPESMLPVSATSGDQHFRDFMHSSPGGGRASFS